MSESEAGGVPRDGAGQPEASSSEACLQSTRLPTTPCSPSDGTVSAKLPQGAR